MKQLSGRQSGIVAVILNMGCNAGGLISPMLTPWIATFIGWENALHIAGALAVLAAVVWFGIFPDKNDRTFSK